MFGAGLLIGTALIVIIPEGIESLYEAGTYKGHVTCAYVLIFIA